MRAPVLIAFYIRAGTAGRTTRRSMWPITSGSGAAGSTTRRRRASSVILPRRRGATWVEALRGSVAEPAAVDRFCRAVDVFAPLDHLFWGLWAVTQAAALNRTTGFRYLLYASSAVASVGRGGGRARRELAVCIIMSVQP